MANHWKDWKGISATNILNGVCRKAVTETLNSIGNVTDTIIPLDEGPLMNSRYEKVKISILDIEGVLAYGGGNGTGKPSLPYAIRWHEIQANFQHGRQKNYLRGPFERIAKVKLIDDLKSNISSRF